jgi:hypothetical protein
VKRNLFRALIADLKPRRTPRFTIIGTLNIRIPTPILTGLGNVKTAVRVRFCLRPECADPARSVRLQLLGETGNELDRMDGRAAVAFAAEMLMENDDEFLPKEILEDAREELGTNMTDQRAVYACLRILLRGVLDRLLQEYDDEQ